MNVDGVSLQGEQVFKAKMPVQAEPEVEETPQELPGGTEIDELSPTEPQSDIQANDTEQSKGVLRLLLEGHFKGVSNLRLRINFSDELAAIEAEKLQAVAEEKVNAVLESVGGVVESFLTKEDGPTEEQAASVLQFQETFVQAVNEYNSELVADLNTAFDGFVKALNTESGDAPGQAWQMFIKDLRSAFTAATNELTQAFAEVRILPELSEPNGNGVAYEKFLAIYNELRGLQTSTDGQPGSEPLDSVV